MSNERNQIAAGYPLPTVSGADGTANRPRLLPTACPTCGHISTATQRTYTELSLGRRRYDPFATELCDELDELTRELNRPEPSMGAVLASARTLVKIHNAMLAKIAESEVRG